MIWKAWLMHQNRASSPNDRAALPNRGMLRRSAVIVVEFILAFPLFLIFLATVVEFALIIDASQQVAQAARLGAKMAAETANLGNGSFDPPLTADTAATIRIAVNRVLENAGFGPNASQGVTLRHTVGTPNVSTDGSAPDPVSPALPVHAVRVSVSVPLSRVTPNLLHSFGFSTNQKTIDITTTFPSEH
jgi:Flp pilus assembly protein TadG